MNTCITKYIVNGHIISKKNPYQSYWHTSTGGGGSRGVGNCSFFSVSIQYM